MPGAIDPSALSDPSKRGPFESFLAPLENKCHCVTSRNLLVLRHFGERFLAVASFRKMLTVSCLDCGSVIA